MPRFQVVVLCFLGMFASPAHAQNFSIEPLHVSAGTILTFHLQTRLHPTDRDALDLLPQGTLLQLKCSIPSIRV